MPSITSLCWLFLAGFASAAELPRLTAGQSQWLGQRIFTNECNAQEQCLTAWNIGEEFPSLGIGHFIWFSEGQNSPFEETFPDLMLFLRNRGITLPTVVTDNNFDAPWTGREDFLADMHSARMQELRSFLADHKAEQATFIIERFQPSADAIIEAAPADQRHAITARLERLAASPRGLYALIDYTHFKGTGLSEAERYRGEGWGLLQVLSGMDGNEPTVEEFVASARRNLENRVNNSPAERNERRWLQGWFNRLDTYLTEPVVQ